MKPVKHTSGQDNERNPQFASEGYRGRRMLRWLFVERSDPAGVPSDPRLLFLVCAVVGLCSGVVGWAMASTHPGPVVPVCAILAILAGLLGVRSKLRSLGLLGFVMGMFLLPTAISTLIRLFGS